MKKIIFVLLLCSLLGITGCNSKEEAMAMITEVTLEKAEIKFSLNGLWKIQEENTANGQTVALNAYKEETGSSILVIYDDLTKTRGGSLIRMEDYIDEIQTQLKTSKDYNYSCGEVTKESVYGKEYQSFAASVSEVGAKQQYFIRRKEDTMIIIIMNIFGEDTIEEILALGKEM